MILVAALSVGCRRLAPSVSVERGERLLVIAPHPDDETLGAGGLIQRVLSAHGTVRVECYVTQQEVMSSLLAAFVRRTEPFTVFTVAEVRGVGSTIERKGRR